jgi:endosialidase-like protein
VTTGNNNAIPVLIDSAGQLGTLSSSRRFKKEIKPMDTTSESILALKPVTFHYKTDKTDKTNTPQFGLIAEEVADVDPDLVVRDDNGEIYTVRYDQVNAMLLNEFLKEHRAFVEEQRQVKQQQEEIDALKTEIKEQRALIEKLNDKMELKASASQTTANNQ